VTIPLVIDRRQNNKTENDINEKEFSGTLASGDEGEIKAKYKNHTCKHGIKTNNIFPSPFSV